MPNSKCPVCEEEFMATHVHTYKKRFDKHVKECASARKHETEDQAAENVQHERERATQEELHGAFFTVDQEMAIVDAIKTYCEYHNQ